FLGRQREDVVNEKKGHGVVLAPAGINMIAADGEPIAVPAEKEDVQIWPSEADAGCKRNGAAMNEVRAVTINEIRKTRRTTDACERHDLFVLDVPFLEHLVERGEHGEIAATGTPRGMIGCDCFLG